MSNQTADQKWKQIQRNLAEQESFVQSITQKKQTNPKTQNDANVENILSSSIQKAKEKINFLQSKTSTHLSTSRQKLSNSRQKRQKGSEQSSSIAAAMKRLQQRINYLQKQKDSLVRQNKLTKNQLQQTKQQKQSLQLTYEQNRRKSKNLETSLLKDKNYIKQLQAKCRSIQKLVNEKKIAQKQTQLQQKLSTSEMLYRAQNQQMKNILVDLENKQKQLLHLSNKAKQQQIRHLQQENNLHSQIREFKLQLQAAEQKDKKKQSLIDKLKNQIKMLQTQKNKQKLNTSSQLIQNSPRQEQKNNRNRNLLQPSPSHRQHLYHQQLQEQKEKYSELFQAYKLLDEKNKRQKVQIKNYRNKYWQLKDLTKQIIQKISMLPNGVTSQLRYLTVKFNKLQTFGPDYYASTPTKSSRKRSSFGNNQTDRSYSKSKSKSKLKVNLNSNNKSLRYDQDDLNCSKNSAKSNRSQKSNRSVSKKSNRKISKQKQVIISQKSIKANQMRALQHQIQDIRKRYKQLLRSNNNQSDDVDEQIRNQLNDLAMLLQQKSEQLTILKRKK